MTLIFAHRGYRAKYPENTMLAFKEAAEAGADGIELDVHLSADNVPVIMHDEKVDRTSDGSGLVRSMTLTQLKRLTPYAEIPLIAKPNAGMPKVVDGETVYDCGAEEFVALVDEMAAAGVQIFGGCCGKDASHIAALAKAVKDLPMREPAPAYGELLPCATEKDVCYVPASAAYEGVVECSADLEDDLMDAQEEGELLAIAIRSEADLDEFEEMQYLIRKPLCLLCEDAKLLEQALRLYQGRALYEGGLDDEALFPLVRKYGLII